MKGGAAAASEAWGSGRLVPWPEDMCAKALRKVGDQRKGSAGRSSGKQKAGGAGAGQPWRALRGSRNRILARFNAFLINTGSLIEGEKGRDVSWGPKEVQGTAAPPFGK